MLVPQCVGQTAVRLKLSLEHTNMRTQPCVDDVAAWIQQSVHPVCIVKDSLRCVASNREATAFVRDLYTRWAIACTCWRMFNESHVFFRTDIHEPREPGNVVLRSVARTRLRVCR